MGVLRKSFFSTLSFSFHIYFFIHYLIQLLTPQGEVGEDDRPTHGLLII